MERDAEVRRIMVEDFVEAFAGGGWGWLDDARAFRSPWEFELAKVTVPVWFAHGIDDDFAPVQQAQRLAAVLPNAVMSIHSGVGHMDLIADAFNEAVDWLITRR
jgi:pimeloyl-ACP methyl ester carboxylesterase